MFKSRINPIISLIMCLCLALSMPLSGYADEAPDAGMVVQTDQSFNDVSDGDSSDSEPLDQADVTEDGTDRDENSVEDDPGEGEYKSSPTDEADSPAPDEEPTTEPAVTVADDSSEESDDSVLSDDVPCEDDQASDERPVSERTYFSQNVEYVNITISAPEGVFPAGTTFCVNKVTVPDQVLEDILSDNQDLIQAYSYDITAFYEGCKIQPDTEHGTVSVKFENIGLPGSCETTLVHVADDMSSVDEIISDALIASEAVSFETEHFSVYTFLIHTYQYNRSTYNCHVTADYGMVMITDVFEQISYDYSSAEYVSFGETLVDNPSSDLPTLTETSKSEDGVIKVRYGYGPILESYVEFVAATAFVMDVLLYDSSFSYIDSIVVSIIVEQDDRYLLGPNVYGEYDLESKTLTVEGSGTLYYISETLSENPVRLVNLPFGQEVEHVVWNASCSPSLFFKESTSLTDVTGTGWESLSALPWNVFEGCTSLNSITLPENITTIPTRAFYKCTGLTSIQIPNNVTSIGDYSFAYSGLTSLVIPAGVTAIEGYAFRNCHDLEIAIPSSVTSIGSYGLANVKKIVLDNVTLSSAYSLGCSYYDVDDDYAAVSTLDAGVTYNATLVYSLPMFTVIFDSNGGSAVASKTVQMNSPVSSPYDNPSCPGFSFSYWYLDDPDVPYDFSSPVISDITLTARWEELMESTVTFYSTDNGEFYWIIQSFTGSCGEEMPSFFLGETLGMGGRSIMTFIGWRDTLTNELFTPGPMYYPDHDADYYAVYEYSDAEYTMRFHANNLYSSGSMSSLSFTYGDGTLIPDSSFNTSAGMMFSGWKKGYTEDGYWDNELGMFVEEERFIMSDVIYEAGQSADAAAGYPYNQEWSNELSRMVYYLDMYAVWEESETLDKYQLGDNVWGEFDSSSGVLTVTGSGDMYDFTSVPDPLADIKSDIISIVVSDEVTSIGAAFGAGMTRLEEVHVTTNTLRSIHSGAFAGCTSLETIIFDRLLLDSAFELPYTYYAVNNPYGTYSALPANTVKTDFRLERTYRHPNPPPNFLYTWYAGNDSGNYGAIDDPDTVPDDNIKVSLRYYSLGDPSSGYMLLIDGNGVMAGYSSASVVPWNAYASEIKSVLVNPTMTNIGSYVFAGCSQLESIDLSNMGFTGYTGITDIGTGALDGTERLNKITLGDGEFTTGYALSSPFIRGDTNEVISDISAGTGYNTTIYKCFVRYYDFTGNTLLNTEIISSYGGSAAYSNDDVEGWTTSKHSSVANADLSSITEGITVYAVPRNFMNTFTVTLPLFIELDKDESDGLYKKSFDIVLDYMASRDDTYVSVSASDFEMASDDDRVTATVSQDRTKFSRTDMTADPETENHYVGTGGVTITANITSPGTYSGNATFTISTGFTE